TEAAASMNTLSADAATVGELTASTRSMAQEQSVACDELGRSLTEIRSRSDAVQSAAAGVLEISDVLSERASELAESMSHFCDDPALASIVGVEASSPSASR
ncbi:MAG: hypothetical protein KDA28_08615, partial [Phycisphaerales bacterium]|nr:hypothetical protein [Phycisphaerales bacterium]